MTETIETLKTKWAAAKKAEEDARQEAQRLELAILDAEGRGGERRARFLRALLEGSMEEVSRLWAEGEALFRREWPQVIERQDADVAEAAKRLGL